MTRGAPTLIETSPGPKRISPGIIVVLRNRVVDGDQLRAVGKRCLHLHVVQHLRDAVHHVVTAQHLTAADHQLGDGPPVAGPLQQVVGEHSDGLGMVQAQSAALTTPCKLGCVGDQQPIGLVRSQAHTRRSCHGLCESAGRDWSRHVSARFCSRTSPRATTRSLSSVIVVTHSCCLRPRWIGVATAYTVPALIARRKSVLLLTPTTVPPPFSESQVWPQTLDRLSTIAQ